METGLLHYIFYLNEYIAFSKPQKLDLANQVSQTHSLPHHISSRVKTDGAKQSSRRASTSSLSMDISQSVGLVDAPSIKVVKLSDTAASVPSNAKSNFEGTAGHSGIAVISLQPSDNESNQISSQASIFVSQASSDPTVQFHSRKSASQAQIALSSSSPHLASQGLQSQIPQITVQSSVFQPVTQVLDLSKHPVQFSGNTNSAFLFHSSRKGTRSDISIFFHSVAARIRIVSACFAQINSYATAVSTFIFFKSSVGGTDVGYIGKYLSSRFVILKFLLEVIEL